MIVPNFKTLQLNQNSQSLTSLKKIGKICSTRKRAMNISTTPTKSTAKKKQAVINMAKWEAANAYAKQNRIRFRVLSEEQLFHNGTRK